MKAVVGIPVFVLPLAAMGLLWAHGDSTAKTAQMEIVLEWKDGQTVKAVDPGHVFAPGDMLRFNFHPTFDGFLYVTDQSSSGKSVLLFPRDETGKDNHIQSGLGYVIPASKQGWFRVEGPAGYETVYFVVSPADLGTVPGYVPLAPPVPSVAPPGSLRPRCDDEVLKARGDCVDISAGPKVLTPGDSLPGSFSSLPEATSRDLIVIKKPTSSVISTGSTLTGPAIYTFRIAHN